jgi:murein tripeptide amidase MpaA
MRIWLIIAFLFVGCSRKNHPVFMGKITIPFEQNPNQTLTYEEIITTYQALAAAYPRQFHLGTMGTTDIGEPLHVAVLSADGEFDAEKIRRSGRRILLINNGIHPGEPEGIDATILLLRDMLTKPDYQKLLEHLVIVAIPVYNVDGCINRSGFSRANQNGPEQYGFRGNARNYDLNRDFVKCDSRNARAFNAVFRHWMPDVFVDNHTSNGADYQYTMTLIPTLHSKLEAPLGDFLSTKMLPYLFREMKNRRWEMIPYVDTPGPTPESGIVNFCDYGRYSTGYAALWNTIGFMPETHMLKPFADRLESTRQFMEVVIGFIHQNHRELAEKRAQAFEQTKNKSLFHLDYSMDASRHDSILFKGYEAKYKPSEVSGLPRLWYDRSAPYEKMIPYYNYFKPSVSVEKPVAYIIPQAWENVLERLKINQVVMEPLQKDTTMTVQSYRIGSFKNREAWEGHYYHSRVQLETIQHERTFRKGDLVVYVNQEANRYLVETLEPNAPDSWFAWNFFDPILMQKEYFSDYVFEDLAAQFLKENPAIRTELEAKKLADPEFANDGAKQLDWVYRKSPWYEPTHRLYPVARLLK